MGEESLTAQREINAGKLRDAEETTNKEIALLNSQQNEIKRAIAEVQAGTGDAVEKAQIIGDLKQREIELELRKTQAQIEGIRQVKPESIELIDLEEKLKDLRSQQGIVAQETADQVVAAKEREKTATEGVIDATGKQKGAMGELAQVARLTYQAVGAQIDYSNLEDVEAKINQLRQNIWALRQMGFTAAADVYSKQLQEVFAKRDAMFAEQAAKEQAERERQAQQARDEATKAAEDLARDREKIETDHNSKMEKIKSDLKKLVEDFARDEVAIKKRASDDLTKLTTDRAKREKETAERLADELIRNEIELNKSLKDIRSRAKEESLDSEADFIDQEVELRKRRGEAKTPEEQA